MHASRILAFAASISAAAAQIKGFNYGSTFTTGAAKQQSDFEAEFSTASVLVGAPGFTSARLFTMIQAGTANTPISAIPAAIATNTSLLLGLWASAGQANLNNEITALTSAITQYGTAFTDLIVGISVGSEDLYRISPTGILNEAGVGANPDEIVNYISQVRSAIAGTLASGKPVGHVDTWTAWVNGTNNPVINASDFLGLDAYPYFQNTQANSIENGNSLFFAAYDATAAVSAGKPIWVSETGWPVSGPTENQAVASIPNAQQYWDQVGCSLFGTTNTWWYTLQDAAPNTPSPSFGVVGSTLSTTPLFNLTCPAGTPGDPPGSASSSATPSAPVSSVASATAPASTAAGASILSSAPNPVPGPSEAAPVGSVGSSAQAPASSAAPVTSGAASSVAGSGSAPTSTPASGANSAAPAPSAPAASSCPASLAGAFEFPHLIVPVDKTQPGKAFGTSYNGEFSPNVSSLFNFDIPASYSGKTCSLVFLFPTQAQLEISSFTMSGSGGISVSQLQSPATQSTTYSSVPAGTSVGGVDSVQPGNSYVVTSGPCAAGQTVGYGVSATGSLDLKYFQNYSPSPIGLYITVC